MTVKCTFCKDTKQEPGTPGPCVWCECAPDNVVQRHTIAHLRYAGGEEHNVKYVSEVDYDRVVAEREQLQQDLTARDEEIDTLRDRLSESSAQLQLAKKLLRQTLSSLNPRNRLATSIRDLLNSARPKPSTPKCGTCKGTGMVDDGEITGVGGVEFENGPVKCVKECPDCKPIEREKLAERCDGKEQEAFEAWAKGQNYDMACHPLHWLFLDSKTYAARQGWAAGLEYATGVARAALERKP